jgi:hypothetical protein
VVAEAQTSAQSDPQSERQPTVLGGPARVYRRRSSVARFLDGPDARSRMVISLLETKHVVLRSASALYLLSVLVFRAATGDRHIRASRKIISGIFAPGVSRGELSVFLFLLSLFFGGTAG